jgi:hypothetical protein
MAAGNWSCYHDVATSVFGECGLGGTCNTTVALQGAASEAGAAGAGSEVASCICKEGWSGHTDFVPHDLREWGGSILMCGVHFTTLRVLWALPLIPLVMLIHATVRAFQEQLKT